MLPTKKGVTLTVEMWKKLLSIKEDIDATIENMARGIPGQMRPPPEGCEEEEMGLNQNEDEFQNKMTSVPLGGRPPNEMGEEGNNEEDYGEEI